MYLKNRIFFFYYFISFCLLFFSFHFLHISLFRFVFVGFGLLSLVSFYFVFISLISFRFVSFLLISFRFVSFRFRFRWFRFVSFLFRFALYMYPFILSINKNGRIIRFQWMNQTTKRKAPSGRAALARTTRKDKHRKYRSISEMRNALKLNQ